MYFTMEFECDNAPFADFPEGEVAEILNDIRHSVLNGIVSDIIIDNNGNFIGQWKFGNEE